MTTGQTQMHVCRSRLRESSAEGCAWKKFLTSSEKQAAVKTIQAAFAFSVVRSCTAVGLAQATYYQDPVDWQIRDATVIEALNEMVEAHPAGACGNILFGYGS